MNSKAFAIISIIHRQPLGPRNSVQVLYRIEHFPNERENASVKMFPKQPVFTGLGLLPFVTTATAVSNTSFRPS